MRRFRRTCHEWVNLKPKNSELPFLEGIPFCKFQSSFKVLFNLQCGFVFVGHDHEVAIISI